MYALQMVRLGKNTFVTGSPGSGKSHFVKVLKDFCYYVLRKKPCIASTTAQSATVIEDNTIHSTLGIGTSEQDPKKMVDRITKSIELEEKFRNIQVKNNNQRIPMLSRCSRCYRCRSQYLTSVT
jgi:dephospho-CoA kinase